MRDLIHVLGALVIAFAFFAYFQGRTTAIMSGQSPGEAATQAVASAAQPESPCEAAIKASLRNPAFATIQLLAQQAGENPVAIYEVRAQNGFGGNSIERWACTDEDGKKVAFAWGS